MSGRKSLDAAAPEDRWLEPDQDFDPIFEAWALAFFQRNDERLDAGKFSDMSLTACAYEAGRRSAIADHDRMLRENDGLDPECRCQNA